MSSISEHIESDDAKKSSLWWLKSTVRTVKSQNPQINITTPKGAETNITSPNKQLELDISTSIDEYLENDPMYSTGRTDDASDADIGSIIEEINKLASQSPIGHYENPAASDKSVEEILQEAEKIYIESSKSFEQLSSSKSRSSLDISLSKSSSLTFKSKKSTPSPKSNHSFGKLTQDFEKLDVIPDDCVEPAPDPEQNTNFEREPNDNDPIELNNNDDDPNMYEDEEFDFESISEKDEDLNFVRIGADIENKVFDQKYFETYLDNIKKSEKMSLEKLIPGRSVPKENYPVTDDEDLQENIDVVCDEDVSKEKIDVVELHEIHETEKDDELEKEAVQEMQTSPDPEEDIEELRQEIENLKIQLQETKEIIKNNETLINKKSYSLQQELDETIEQLKDTREQNTVLQLQLDNLTKTHQELKSSYEDLFATKKNLELKIIEIDSNFTKCKSELISVKGHNSKLSESEASLKKLLEIERLQSKTARLQNEKDTKCIQDLNRQVKEMERIIQRKQPDSLSALIVPNKNESEANNAARALLENRIKQLEQEAHMRELQSNNVFTEIQDKFNQMKDKYERHIEDLEVHVNDLKQQLRSKTDTYDIYTQTYTEEPAKLKEESVKELFDIGVQTDIKVESAKQPKPIKKPEKIIDSKEDAHLIATIRGLHADLATKDKLYMKLQKELEELRKTNRKLQKDRETTLRIVSERKEKTQDKQIAHSKSPEPIACNEVNDDLKSLKDERDKLKAQLCRLEDDYQNLKTKRLQDLNILQEAHEREVTTYMSNIGPMREQLNVQQISINNLQKQLATAKEELAIITVERDHLDSRIKNITLMNSANGSEDETTQLSLQKKIAFLERRYEEREIRLRAIVHGLAQKHVTGRDCPQCAARQQQLIGYKAELDQLLATLRFQNIAIYYEL